MSSEFGRVPVTVVEIDQDTCLNTYGVSPCTAGVEDSGTAQAGDAGTLTLRAGASAVDDAYNGMTIRLLTGPGSVQERRISDYVGATKVATVSPRWATNLLPRSEEFDDAGWGKGGPGTPSITANADGDADLFQRDSTAGSYIGRAYTKSASAAQTFVGSVKVKKNVGNYAALRLQGTYPARADVVFNIATGAIHSAASAVSGFSGASASIEPDDEIPGYWRISLIATTDAASTVQFYWSVSSNGVVIDGTDSVSNSSLYCIAAQLEHAAELGRYIKTEAAAITRPDNTSTYSVIDRPNACFNTFKTCQDADNFNKGTKVIRFCKPLADMPKDWLAIPSVMGASQKPSRINAGGQAKSSGALGERGTVTVNFTDHPGSDLDLDPYVEDRTYDPLTRGTFWTKWRARNPYYQNRALRVRNGYLGEEPGDMMTYHYVIDRLEGPDSSGRVTLKGMDVLRLADDTKAQAPALSRGELQSDIDAAVTAFNIVGATIDEYDAPAGTLRIGDEVITYTSMVDNAGVLEVTGATRGAEGTEAEAHDAEDQVQRCLRYTAEPVIDILEDLLTTYAGIDGALIDAAGWTSESDTWLTGYELSTLITEPVGVATLLEEICEQVLLFLWWDEREQLIRLKVLRPPTEDPVSLNDTANVLQNTQTFKDDPEQRISQLWIFYGQRNPTLDLDEETNYRFAKLRIADDAEGANQFDETKVKKIYSRWLQTFSQVNDTGARILARYKENPLVGSIVVDAKDRDTWTGDLIRLTSRLLVDETGAEVAKQFHVIAAEEIVPGEQIRFDLQNFEPVASKQGRYMADDAPDYLDATDEERALGAWYSDEDGLMSDGAPGWRYQ